MNTSFTVIYLGGPTMIIEINGLRILTDPTLDPEGTAFPISESVTETKLAGPAVSDIGRIDLILLSHDQHWDNLDHAGRKLIASGIPTLTTVVGSQRLGGHVKGLLPWDQFVFSGSEGESILITATPARHGRLVRKRLPER
ncbi:MAG TPA: MBL fold metallo-hydrolase [Puia sp.]|jgi:L-ascorbate metabolism protein UlaG (beta-lactamase superfamily)